MLVPENYVTLHNTFNKRDKPSPADSSTAVQVNSVEFTCPN